MAQIETKKKINIAVISNSPNEIRERAEMFFNQVFKTFQDKIAWEYISYKDLLEESNFNKAKSMDGLILSSSNFIISDPIVQEKMLVEMYLVREFKGPIYGMCFGHHLLEFMFGAPVTEQSPVDFFNNSIINFETDSQKKHINSSKLAKIQYAPIIENNLGSIVNFPDNTEYKPLFRDDFEIQTPPPLCEIYAKQHQSLPIYGVDFRMDENAPDEAFRTAVDILQKFLNHFFT